MEDRTCADRITDSLDSHATSIAVMLNPSEDDIEIKDNGTLDTVVVVDDVYQESFSPDFVADYREDNGEIDLEQFRWDIFDEVREKLYEAFYDYALCFDYVSAVTDEDEYQRGFFRYQISWGGPSEEFRFYTDEFLNLTHTEYWFLDWFDGASKTIGSTHEHYETVQMLWSQFKDSGTVDYLFKEAA